MLNLGLRCFHVLIANKSNLICFKQKNSAFVACMMFLCLNMFEKDVHFDFF